MSMRVKEKQIAARRKKVRMRFRGLIRTVIFNKLWLMDVEEQKLSTNVRRNIAMLVRQKRKIGILTMAEKTLIRTATVLRTVEERKRLVTLMSSLTCFSRLPPKIRARLAPVVSFLYLNAERIIIKEGNQPIVLYFILTGEVEMYRNVWDNVRKDFFEKIMFIGGPGESIGEIAMIEKGTRMYTCRSTTEVELLAVYEEDFDEILRPFMTKQWEDKKQALRAFDYFNNWNREQITYVCKNGLLKQFEPLETIYYEDRGYLDYVHFVISGQCMILQCLKMKTKQKGKKTFDLIDITSEGNDMFFSELTDKELLKKIKRRSSSKRADNADDEDSVQLSEKSVGLQVEADEAGVPGVKVKPRRSDYKNYSVLCGLEKVAENFDDPNATTTTKEDDPNKSIQENTHSDNSNRDKRPSEEENISLENANQNKRSSKTSNLSKIFPEINSDTKLPSDEVESIHHSKPKESTSKVENHFIDVGSLTYGGIFGLGEKMEHRVIMARTTVQCILIPRFWLMENPQNPGNIWQRMRFYLDSTIPSRTALFRDFLATQKWHKFKKDLIQECLQPMRIGNPTKIQDIPVICRIVEADDDDD